MPELHFQAMLILSHLCFICLEHISASLKEDKLLVVCLGSFSIDGRNIFYHELVLNSLNLILE